MEEEALEQVNLLLSQDALRDCKVRIMPDAHAGKGCVIGFTADLGDKVIPNIVGVDIGCGMLTVELGKTEFSLNELDKTIREKVPFGRAVHEGRRARFPEMQDMRCYRELKDTKRLERSVGTLGVLIPVNMRDGCIVGIGKGNDDWNQSAPHGAGRLMSRHEAREALSLDEFRASMAGIFTTSVGEDTIDEAPMAYKPLDEIRSAIGDTVEVERMIKPIYNFKASE